MQRYLEGGFSLPASYAIGNMAPQQQQQHQHQHQQQSTGMQDAPDGSEMAMLLTMPNQFSSPASVSPKLFTQTPSTSPSPFERQHFDYFQSPSSLSEPYSQMMGSGSSRIGSTMGVSMISESSGPTPAFDDMDTGIALEDSGAPDPSPDPSPRPSRSVICSFEFWWCFFFLLLFFSFDTFYSSLLVCVASVASCAPPADETAAEGEGGNDFDPLRQFTNLI
jgi:hypothetical protein